MRSFPKISMEIDHILSGHRELLARFSVNVAADSPQPLEYT